MIENISLDLKEMLIKKGATLVGFGDISELVKEQEDDMKYGISVVVCMSPNIVKNIENGPTQEYHLEYKRLNLLLDKLVVDGANYLQKKGFKALAQTTESVKEFGTYRTLFPHKSFATRTASGEEWDVTKDRDDFFDPLLCRKQARIRAAKIGIEETICGKCIQICPYTQRYINR